MILSREGMCRKKIDRRCRHVTDRQRHDLVELVSMIVQRPNDSAETRATPLHSGTVGSSACWADSFAVSRSQDWGEVGFGRGRAAELLQHGVEFRERQ